MRSTSLHRITADKGNFFYKIIVRLLYFPLNIYNNRQVNKNIDPELQISVFKPKDLDDNYKQIEEISSPSRKLSDLFWMNLEWEKILNDSGEINICDLGCGSGKYYFKLKEYSGNRINKYYGFDIQEHQEWKMTENDLISFKSYDGKNILNLIPDDANLIISQSAIEHFQEDMTIFKQLKSFTEKSSHTVEQIHLFPSKEGLKLFGYHGVRQYTPRTVSKLTRLFNTAVHKELVIIGGKESTRVHLDFIRKKDIREERKEEYNQACLEAMHKEFKGTIKTNDANFYALRIK